MQAGNDTPFAPDDCIVACASAAGGQVAIIRISGLHAVTLAQAAGLKLDKPWHSTQHNWPIKNAHIPCRILYAAAPNSFTGHDCIEVSVPAAPVVIEQCLQHCLQHGMQTAAPGAFCRQALANKRMHLDQAEAILALTQASDADACQDALSRLRGALSQDIEQIRQQCIELRARVEAGLDFLDEEDVRAYDPASLQGVLNDMRHTIGKWQRAAVSLGEDPIVCLVGKANAGKSALFQALCGAQVLISDQAGTTRDFLEETWDCNGRSLRLIDTAGWLEQSTDDLDAIDNAALQAGQNIFDHAQFIIACSAPDARLPDDIQDRLQGRPYVICSTKEDLGVIDERAALALSVEENTGIHALKTYIAEQLGLSASGEPRQQRHLNKADHIITQLQNGLPPDELLADDLRQIAEHLGDLIGITTTDDIMDVIFSRFCIGK